MDSKLLELLEKEKSKPQGTFTKIFSNNLKYFREEKGLTHERIAEIMGIPRSTYSNWEQGRREPGLFDIYNFMWALDITADELFDIDGYKNK